MIKTQKIKRKNVKNRQGRMDKVISYYISLIKRSKVRKQNKNEKP